MIASAQRSAAWRRTASAASSTGAVADIQEKIANNTYGVKFGSERLQALIDRMEKEVLPKFTADPAALKKSIKERGLEVD